MTRIVRVCEFCITMQSLTAMSKELGQNSQMDLKNRMYLWRLWMYVTLTHTCFLPLFLFSSTDLLLVSLQNKNWKWFSLSVCSLCTTALWSVHSGRPLPQGLCASLVCVQPISQRLNTCVCFILLSLQFMQNVPVLPSLID